MTPCVLCVIVGGCPRQTTATATAATTTVRVCAATVKKCSINMLSPFCLQVCTLWWKGRRLHGLGPKAVRGRQTQVCMLADIAELFGDVINDFNRFTISETRTWVDQTLAKSSSAPLVSAAANQSLSTGRMWPSFCCSCTNAYTAWETNDENLRRAFSKCGEINEANVRLFKCWFDVALNCLSLL